MNRVVIKGAVCQDHQCLFVSPVFGKFVDAKEVQEEMECQQEHRIPHDEIPNRVQHLDPAQYQFAFSFVGFIPAERQNVTRIAHRCWHAHVC